MTPELWRVSDCEELVGSLTGDDIIEILGERPFKSGGPNLRDLNSLIYLKCKNYITFQDLSYFFFKKSFIK